MIQTITLAPGKTLGVVVVPAAPGMRTIEWDREDSVAINRSPFTGKVQTYTWPGADQWSGMLTLPPLRQAEAAQWESFLLECRGMANPFLIGDPTWLPVTGLQGSLPVVDSSDPASNRTGMTTLVTGAWIPNARRVLLPGMHVQVGFRVYRNLDVVNVDSAGAATLSLWPSLREAPLDGARLVFHNGVGGGIAAACGPVGLFRRSSNKFSTSVTVGQMTSLSFGIQEYR